MQHTPLAKVGRVAFREEGQWWVAYYAKTENMEDAFVLGTLHMGLAERPSVKAKFIGTMREAVSDIIREATGVTPAWENPVTAPEHERTKKA